MQSSSYDTARAQAADTAGLSSRLPPFNSDDASFYYGTVVASSNDSTSLPIMEWCVPRTALLLPLPLQASALS